MQLTKQLLNCMDQQRNKKFIQNKEKFPWYMLYTETIRTYANICSQNPLLLHFSKYSTKSCVSTLSFHRERDEMRIHALEARDKNRH